MICRCPSYLLREKTVRSSSRPRWHWGGAMGARLILRGYSNAVEELWRLWRRRNRGRGCFSDWRLGAVLERAMCLSSLTVGRCCSRWIVSASRSRKCIRNASTGPLIASLNTLIHQCVQRISVLPVSAAFFTRNSSYCFQRVLAIAILSACPSVCPSVTRVHQSKTVQAKITKSSPSAAWKTLVSGFVKLFHKFERGQPQRGDKWVIVEKFFAIFSRYGVGWAR